ncbi:MAG: hypothetical protein AYK23_02530 [Candidatus Proteinoplasmatales archaeon SG8-5]|nr:MAG: hypothetical protein AYK23_02530 [Candidatus Proteinoplasmatales archaeon SG8-5]
MLGKKKLKGDKTTQTLQASGAYTLGHAPHPYVVDPSTAEAIKKKNIYSFWSGVWYTTILSILLFWIPPFGQMIAGYVGGRKAGTPKKGLVAALVPMSIVFMLFILIRLNIMVDELGWVFGLPLEGADYLSANLPLIGTLVSFSTDYIQTFVETMGFGGNFIAPYVLTVIFGYVGGILSLQHQRELEEEEQPLAQPVIVQQPVIQAQQPAAPPQQDAQQQEDAPVVMGKKPDGWDIKKDRKKGKW